MYELLFCCQCCFQLRITCMMHRVSTQHFMMFCVLSDQPQKVYGQAMSKTSRLWSHFLDIILRVRINQFKFITTCTVKACV